MEHKDASVQAAEAAGFDINLIELNLSLSPEERVRQHEIALDLVLALEAAKKKADGEISNSASTPR